MYLWLYININYICKNKTAKHYKFRSAIIRINTEGKSLMMNFMKKQWSPLTAYWIFCLTLFKLGLRLRPHIVCFECGLISRILYQLITHQFYVHSDELYNINKKREKCKIKNKLQDMKVTVWKYNSKYTNMYIQCTCVLCRII